ncbi:hypothetical protein TYRP_004197 [Tyrophagus putrescentiae]|nr:hypothetical protein TYRP_004197 [Tyrophagus putrescentiae]
MFSRRSALQLLHRLNSAKLYSTTSALLCKCRSIGLQSSVPLETTPGNKAFKPVQSSGQFNVITRQLSSSGGSGEQPPQKSSKNDDDDKSNNEEEFEVPLLMDGILPRGMPNLFFTLKNFYLINFVLRPQIDKSFDIKEFIEGAKQAFIFVSSSIANNQLDNLNGLVEKEALEEIKKNYKRLSLPQRQEFELIKSDIVITFAHHVRIETLKEEFTGTRKHIVYFFMVFDCVRNLENILKEKAAKREQEKARDMFKEFNTRKMVCNYEFKREYIDSGPCTDWIITKLMHIKEKDLVRIIYNQRFNK